MPGGPPNEQAEFFVFGLVVMQRKSEAYDRTPLET
jgi:hypothetical protein